MPLLLLLSGTVFLAHGTLPSAPVAAALDEAGRTVKDLVTEGAAHG